MLNTIKVCAAPMSRRWVATLLPATALAVFATAAPAAAQSVFVNEFHYDNDGTDSGEFIEIAGPAGTDLSAWSLVLYNGANGLSYTTTPLSGVIPDQQGGFGTRAFAYPVNGIQNGAPDGFALVNGTTVAQFLSYEGSFSANDGPATGLASFDIGVSESSSTPVGHSLQLAGTGTVYTDFAWQPAQANTSGVINTGQTFSAPPPVPDFKIAEIQGNGHTSPQDGNTVRTRGIVTGISPNGFFIQDPTPDDDDATSDGIFVFTGSRPSVAIGDDVTVTGPVLEFRGSATSRVNDLTLTQISRPSAITTNSSGNPLPAPIVLGSDRTAPTEVFDNDGLTTFDPDEDGVDFYESLEGMRVTLPNARAVSTNFGNFGEVYAISGGTGTGENSRGGITMAGIADPTTVFGDQNPERLQIDDENFRTTGVETPKDINVGDRLGTGTSPDLTGTLTYSFGAYELLPNEAIVKTSSGLQRETTRLVSDLGQLTVANYNVENLDPGDGARFGQIAAQIVDHLKAPDIIALQEIQDNDGPTNSGTVAADLTLQTLVDAIADAGGPAYAFIDNPFIGNNTNGGEPGANIRTTYLYRPDRVDLDPASLATTTDPTDQQTNSGNPFFDSRLPLAATFEFDGEDITLINNHFASKGGSSPLFGKLQPPINGGIEQRRAQAESVADYVSALLAADPNAFIIVLGDLNEYYFDPLFRDILLPSGLLSLWDELPETERYSYVFDGNSQTLDHMLVSAALHDLLNGFDVVHINAEFQDQVSDHDPLVAAFRFAAAVAVPLPGSALLLFVGLGGMAIVGRRRRPAVEQGRPVRRARSRRPSA